MIVELSIFILTTFLAYHLYVYKKIHNYFNINGIKYFPGVPVFGNVLKSTFLKKHIIEEIDSVYKAYPAERYVGFIEYTKPLILIREPELIKSIMIKNFDHFTDRKNYFPEEIAPLLGKSLVMMRGESWREMRTSLSPSFTGSKLRLMMPFITQVSDDLMEYLKHHTSEELDMMDLMHRYTHDVIASTIMGVQVNSVKNRENKLFMCAKETVRFTIGKAICYYFALQFPIVAKIMKHLNIGILPEEGINLFRDIIATTIEYRKKHDVIRPDFIHLLMKASEEWTPDDIAGQAYFSFLAGFEASSSNLTMCIHELAIDPKIQERLYQEIKNNEEINGELSYDNINQLKYLDCVLNETSRKWSSAMMLDRVCTKPYLLPPSKEGGKPYQVNPGDLLYGVLNSIQMDPSHHPDPEVFNPDRFSDENVHKIKPFTFMPFGVGPRTCLGMRLAILQAKILIYNLVLNFKIVQCSKTAKPIRLEANVFNVRAIGGTWVRLETRN